MLASDLFGAACCLKACGCRTAHAYHVLLLHSHTGPSGSALSSRLRGTVLTPGCSVLLMGCHPLHCACQPVIILSPHQWPPACQSDIQSCHSAMNTSLFAFPYPHHQHTLPPHLPLHYLCFNESRRQHSSKATSNIECTKLGVSLGEAGTLHIERAVAVSSPFQSLHKSSGKQYCQSRQAIP